MFFFRRKPRKSPTRRLGLEALEDRSMPSASPAAPVIDLSGLNVNTQAYDPSHILVQFKTAAGQAAPTALAGTTLGAQLPLVTGLYEVDLSRGVTVPQAVAEYRADAQVASAQPDYLLSTAMTPNDPRFGQQWDLNNTGQDGGAPTAPGASLNAPQAWNVTTGGAKVVVAVMDTGIDYDHPDLYDNVWINQAEIPLTRLAHLVDVNHDGYISFADLNNAINQGLGKITDVNHDGRIDAADILAPMVLNSKGQDTGLGGWAFPGNTKDGDTAHPNDYIGWNFVANTNDPFDDNGHGTHVSGTIAAGGNNGTGIAGIDWNAQVMSLKFLGADGTGSVGSFIQALNYAVAHGARISNNSWAGASNSSVLYDAIANARAHGVIVVAAAGNNSSNNDVTPVYPSAFNLDNVVTVAATDSAGRLASFSNYGAHSVNLGAPGVDILSTLPGGNYGYLSGTSMAAPHVTGVLALVWGQHPTWTYNQVIAQVLSTATRDPNLAGKTVTGGVVNAAAAVGSSAAVSVVAPSVTASSAGGPSAGTLDRVRLTFSDPMNASTLAGAVRLQGPSGALIPVTGVQAVANSGGKVFDVLFGAQTAPGQYHLTVTPLAYDTAGLAISTYQATFTLTASPTPAPAVVPAVSSSSAGGPAAGTLDRVRLTFTQPMNVATLAGAVRLVGPNGALVPVTGVQAVANTGGKVFDVLFGAQTAPGSYHLTVTPLAYDTAGLAISTYQANFTLSAPAAPAQLTTTSTAQLVISSTSQTQSAVVIGSNVRVGSVAVRVNITYPRVGDLILYLQAPDGTSVLLVSHQGGWSANFQDTVFSDQGTLLQNARAPFTGTYRPASPLSALAGKNAQGIWKLWVEDTATGVRGTLNNWSLTVTPA